MNIRIATLTLLAGVSLLISWLTAPAAAQSGLAISSNHLTYLPLVHYDLPLIYTNVLVNGSFEEGWTNVPYLPGNLLNQQPNGWNLSWIEPGQPLYNPDYVADGVPECVHKLADQLPPNEQPGGPDALILDGTHTYKVFFGGAGLFGAELRQTVTDLIPGETVTLIVPIQVHQQMGTPDHVWHAYSGVWLNNTGDWLVAGQAGDRTWYEHQVTVTVPDNGEVEVVIRFQTLLPVPFDYFIDDVRLMSWRTQPTD